MSDTERPDTKPPTAEPDTFNEAAAEREADSPNQAGPPNVAGAPEEGPAPSEADEAARRAELMKLIEARRAAESSKRKLALIFFLIGLGVFVLWVVVMLAIGADWRPQSPG